MKPFETQIGGDHYLEFEIQPAEFIQRNSINFLEGNVIKRMCRHDSHNGLEDLEKAIDEIKKIAFIEYGVDLDNRKFLEKSMDEVLTESIVFEKNKATIGFDKDGDFFLKIGEGEATAPQPEGYMHGETVKKNKELSGDIVYADPVKLDDNKLTYKPPTLDESMGAMNNPKKCKRCD